MIFSLFALSLTVAAHLQGPAVSDDDPAKDFAGLNTAFRVDATSARRYFERGIQDGARMHVLPSNVSDLSKRVIGTLDGPSGNENLSWIQMQFPLLTVYEQGFSCSSQGLPKEAVSRLKKSIGEKWSGLDRISLQAVITAKPAYTRSGALKAPADLSVFDDFWVLLEVGGRTYFPVRQPGSLRPAAVDGKYSFTEVAPGMSSSKYKAAREWTYRYYQARVNVMFELFDLDGRPRIRPEDKEIVLNLNFRGQKQRIVFELSKIADPLPEH